MFARIEEGEAGRFPRTGRGDVNTYALFAELAAYRFPSSHKALYTSKNVETRQLLANGKGFIGRERGFDYVDALALAFVSGALRRRSSTQFVGEIWA